MKSKKSLWAIFVVVLLLQVSCSKDKVTPVEENTGKNMFYVAENLTCGTISVTIGDVSKSITSAAGKNPSCSQNGSAMFELKEGTYNYSAKCLQGTQTWEGQIKIYKGECYTTELVIKNDPPENKNGRVIFWLEKDLICGSIKVTIKDSTKYVTTYVKSGQVGCDVASNGAIFSLPQGSYTYSASCSRYKWDGTIDIIAGQCTNFKLVPTGEIIPTYTFSAPQLLAQIDDTPFYNGRMYRISDSDNLVSSSITKYSYDAPRVLYKSVIWTFRHSIVSPPSPSFTVKIGTKFYQNNDNFNRTFVLDREDKEIYAMIYEGSTFFDADVPSGGLYRMRADVSGDYSLITSAEKLGKIQHLIYNSDNQLIATSSNDNGSLIKIGIDGMVTKIATGLRQPSNFCEYNGNYYVTINNVTAGSVLKISPTGDVQTIVSNLLRPCDIVFDRYGNFVLKYEKTVDGVNYFAYDLYTESGILISHIVDENNYILLSSSYTSGGIPVGNVYYSPMFIDESNNLIFDHVGGTPQTRSKRGFWTINLNKQ